MTVKMNKINGWDYWQKNWENANKFFNSEGNIKIKSKLKDKWFKDFSKIFDDFNDILEKHNS